jgi:glycosyltransferase involved in cell wall biosynthesis
MSNILIVGPAHPLRGGIATFNEQLAKSLQQAGHQVEILSFSLQYPDFLFPGTSQFTDEPAPPTLLISSKLNSIQPFNWFWVGNEYRKKPLDIVIFRFWLPFMAPCLGTFSRIMRWGRKNKTKFIAITDNVIPHEKRLGDKVLTHYFLSSCDGFITMAKSVLNDIALFEPNKPKIYTPHPIYDNYGTPISREEALKNLGLNPDFQYVLFFGLIRAYKGLDLLLEAFGEGELKKRKIKLIIAGEPYEDISKYEAIITKYQIENQIIRHTHFIPTEQVANYFSAADLVAQPYKTATQSGVSQIAYHFEKPILVTNVGGLAEIVPHQKVGYVVKPESGEIKNAILDFFDNQRDKAFAEHIKLEKMRFSWETMIGKIFELANTL